MKKKFSLIVALVFIISTISAIPFSAFASTDLLAVSSNLGTYQDITIKDMATGEAVTGARWFGSGSVGSSFVNAPQKSSDDKAFSPKAGTPNNNLRTNHALFANTNKHKYITYEFDLYFGNVEASVSVRNAYVNTLSSAQYFSANFLASSSAKGYNGLTSTGQLNAVYNAVGINKWHRAKVTIPADGKTADTLKMYLDGVLVAQTTANLPLTNPDGDSLYGLTDRLVGGNANSAPQDFYFYNNSTNETYIDNVKIYAGDGNIPASAKPEAQFNTSDFSAVGSDVLFKNSASTVSDILGAVTNSVSYKGIYASDLTTEKDSTYALSEGDVLVIASEDGVYSYYNLVELTDSWKPYQSVDGASTVTTSGTPLPEVTNNVNSWSFTSTASSGVSSTAVVAFPNNLDLTQLGDIYTLSFDIKHELTEAGKTNLVQSGKYVSQLFIYSDGTRYSTSMYQMFNNGNGIKVPSAGTGSLQGAYNNDYAEFSGSHQKIAGMDMNTVYRFQIVVNKAAGKLYYFINDQLVVDASSKTTMVTKMSTIPNISGFEIAMRGGDGTNALVKLTLANFTAVSGCGDLQVTGAQITKNSDNSLNVKWNKINLTGNSYGIKLVAAAYGSEGLIDTSVKDVTLSAGCALSEESTVSFSKDVSGADTFKVFFINNFDNLKPIGESGLLEASAS